MLRKAREVSRSENRNAKAWGGIAGAGNLGEAEGASSRGSVVQDFHVRRARKRDSINVLGKAQSKGQTGKKETAKLGAGAALSLTVSQPRNRR
jgi:hypothetical protein